MKRSKHPVRNSLIIIAVFLVFGGALFFSSANESLEKLKVLCKQPNASKTECMTRMRAGGHYKSKAGELKEAEEFYLIAAHMGDEIAMFHLGWLYHTEAIKNMVRTGRPIDKKVIAQANQWYTKSAKLNFSPAMNNLGVLLMTSDGRGSPQYMAGIDWVISAGRANNPIGVWNAQKYIKLASRNTDDEKNGVWNPRTTYNPKIILSPTLERTFYNLLPVSRPIAEEIRKAAETKTPMKAPNKPSEVPGLAFYNPEIKEKIRRDQQDR
ncbi:MAG: sel1 repeat family protein [Alphaproteobacteria bacterium]|nr:sel1 repeat family protein [Alphaproteobacteria bacterium]